MYIYIYIYIYLFIYLYISNCILMYNQTLYYITILFKGVVVGYRLKPYGCKFSELGIWDWFLLGQPLVVLLRSGISLDELTPPQPQKARKQNRKNLKPETPKHLHYPEKPKLFNSLEALQTHQRS